MSGQLRQKGGRYLRAVSTAISTVPTAYDGKTADIAWHHLFAFVICAHLRNTRCHRNSARIAVKLLQNTHFFDVFESSRDGRSQIIRWPQTSRRPAGQALYQSWRAFNIRYRQLQQGQTFSRDEDGMFSYLNPVIRALGETPTKLRAPTIDFKLSASDRMTRQMLGVLSSPRQTSVQNYDWQPGMQVFRRVTDVLDAGIESGNVGHRTPGTARLDVLAWGRRRYPASFSPPADKFVCADVYQICHSAGQTNMVRRITIGFCYPLQNLKGFRPTNSKVLIYLWVACDCISVAIAIQS